MTVTIGYAGYTSVAKRVRNYRNQSHALTPAQRRRLVKKARHQVANHSTLMRISDQDAMDAIRMTELSATKRVIDEILSR